LARVGLAGKDDLYVEKLNVSERKRLELARAIAMDPDLLLLDEVMAGLNASEMNHIMDLVLELNGEGRTIVVIEHVMKAIMAISQRILVLHHGQKVAEGRPAEIINDERVIVAYLGRRYSKARRENARD
jgi:branched-chain amino acid transport system ATP-binding protein